jgi:N utilization substance protein B
MDKRHLERVKIVQNLFAASFPDLKNNLPYEGDTISDDILLHMEEIDLQISTNAPKFPLDRIAKADLAILRLAVYELLINPKQPYKVVINEAVELAKEFAGDRSYAFVNAVLGSIVKNSKNLKSEDDKT